MRSDGLAATCGRPKRNGQPCDNHPGCAWHSDLSAHSERPMTPSRARRELLDELARIVADLADSNGMDPTRLEMLRKAANE